VGFVSNQWLKDTYLDRSHRPVWVGVVVYTPDDAWCKRRKIVMELMARRKGKYQTLYLTHREATDAIEEIIAFGDDKIRSAVARKVLKHLSDAQLLKAIASVLKGRVRKRQKRAPE
jgi:hypothetical protein